MVEFNLTVHIRAKVEFNLAVHMREKVIISNFAFHIRAKVIRSNFTVHIRAMVTRFNTVFNIRVKVTRSNFAISDRRPSGLTLHQSKGHQVEFGFHIRANVIKPTPHPVFGPNT